VVVSYLTPAWRQLSERAEAPQVWQAQKNENTQVL
jgi:hypothetical protein